MANEGMQTEPARNGGAEVKTRLERVEGDVIVEGRHLADRAARALRKPAVGGAAFGAAVLAAGAVWGASEAAIAALAAYAAYRVLRKRAAKRGERAEDRDQAAQSLDRGRT